MEGTNGRDKRRPVQPMDFRPASLFRRVEAVGRLVLRQVEAYDVAECWEARDAMVPLLERARDLLSRRYGVEL